MLRRLAASFLSLSLLATAATAAPIASAAPPPVAHVAPVAEDIAPVPPRPAPTRAEVAKALAARRAKNLAAFRAYRKARVYPHNFVRTGPLNVWRDREGHLCAAATILSRDGQTELVNTTALGNNNIRLLDVTEGPVLDWMLTSGFTIEEIDQIQMPGFRVAPEPQEPKNWRVVEDRRLFRGYAATDAALVKHRKASLAIAVDRLMERPDLARALVDTTGA
jgi:hypothetical protein